MCQGQPTLQLEAHCVFGIVDERRSPYMPLRCCILSWVEKRYPFTAGLTERVFQSLDGGTGSRSHDIPATFCSITERF